MTNNSSDSKIIGFLRLPLMILIVCIHAQIFLPEQDISYPIFSHIQYFIAIILARPAIPLFFFFSGYLYFYNISTFDFNTYASKTKSRIRSLLVPYIIANTLFIIYAIFETKGEILQYHSNFRDLIRAYWVIQAPNPQEKYPALITLWFLRDLIVLSLITPIIWYLSKKIGVVFIILVFIFFIFPISSIPYLNKSGIFYFSLGAYMSTLKISFSDKIEKIPIKLITILMILLSVFIIFTKPQFFLLRQLILFTYSVFILSISSFFCIKKKVQIPQSIAQTSFFIYLFHVPLVQYVRTYVLDTFPHGNTSLTFSYLLIVIVTTIICIITFFILKKVMPQILNIITGNR